MRDLPEPSSPRSIHKRVCKACDRCRLKKAKCDGLTPCSRCQADNAICVFGHRRKSYDRVYPKGYVEMLENQQSQLVAGLQELYKRLQYGEGWTESPLKDDEYGIPLTHDILEWLGLLKRQVNNPSEAFEENFNFEEDLEALHQVIGRGASPLRRCQSLDARSDIDNSSFIEQISQHLPSTNISPSPTSHYTPTPPSEHFTPPCHKVAPRLETLPRFTPPQAQSDLVWQQDMNLFTDNMNLNMAYDMPMSDQNVDLLAFADLTYHDDQTALAIYPYLTIPEWLDMDGQMQQ